MGAPVTLGQVQRNSPDDVKAFLRQLQELSLEERHVLILLFDDYPTGVQTVDAAIAERGLSLTGQPAD